MKYVTNISLSLKTSTGTLRLKAGDTFIPKNIESIKGLVKKGKLKPVLNGIDKMPLSKFKNSTTVLRVYSLLLGEEILFSPSPYITFKKKLKKYGLPIYTAGELISILRNVDDKDFLKKIHMTKKIMGGTLKERGDAI
jgi:hypothetical protein|tara:strand:+ start:86 stop:499 length:414 start_codon:yes stop_codon:yes gene_type:complete